MMMRTLNKLISLIAVVTFGSVVAEAIPKPETKINYAERIVPELPARGEKMRLLIDTDAANEIDDLYAVALAVACPERFELEGLVATHFAQKTGPESIEQSYQLLLELFAKGGMEGRYRIEKGGDPMMYQTVPQESPGARFIIERAHAGSVDDPLWVVALGAMSNVASALLIDPSIREKVRLVCHVRSEWSWPERSEQFNVGGDPQAVRALLTSGAPLVWFDTGQQLTCPMDVTEKNLVPLGGMPAYLHEFRKRATWFQKDNKGFFDLGDIAWMVDPDVCTNEVVDVPHMDWVMKFQHRGDLGRMLRVHTCKKEPVWGLFFERMRQLSR